jgi:hypothetical protein
MIYDNVATKIRDEFLWVTTVRWSEILWDITEDCPSGFSFLASFQVEN